MSRDIKKTGDDSVRMDICFPVAPEEVWDAWTIPDLILQWFGSDPDGTGVKADIDLRRGGSYEISFANSDRSVFTCFGKYTELEKYRRLGFTWMWKNEPGVESFVALQLSPEDGSTRMQFTHERLGWASSHDYEEGWRRTFLKLERVLVKWSSR
ncbi:MAG TPA: SRPBCC domain-containing protein [Puia sp.]|nr:SRPBCC domain-containing protein [Puia sp.]